MVLFRAKTNLHMVVDGHVITMKSGEMIEMPRKPPIKDLDPAYGRIQRDAERRRKRDAVRKALRKGLKPIKEEPKKSPKKFTRKVRCL